MVAGVDLMKCACDKCLCIIKVENSVEGDGKYYCSEACAEVDTPHAYNAGDSWFTDTT
ncbi:MAG: metallothionein [Rivularia sp. (in: cyanobacteria)]